MRWRRTVVRLHRWLSLVLGVWICLMAVTGFIRLELDRRSGRVLHVGDPDDFNVATQLYERWSFPLHTGSLAVDLRQPPGEVALPEPVGDPLRILSELTSGDGTASGAR